MADAVVDMAATMMFGLGANFKAQSSSDSDLDDFAQIQDANGDTGGGCESSAFNARNEYSLSAGYCGTALVTDLSVIATTFGVVADAKAPTELIITWRNDAQPEVTINGHNHDANAHAVSPALATYNISADIPANGGVIVPDIWANAAGAVSDPISVTLRFSLEHVDQNNADGAHFVGENKNCRADVTAEYVGVPSLTTTGWAVDSVVSADSNSAFDTTTYTAHKFYTRI